jgi:hypothetical protein
MKLKHTHRIMAVIIICLVFSLSVLVSCVGGTPQVSFYNAGASNFTATSSQFAQYFLYRFDTSSSGLSFTLPTAAAMVSVASSPVAGQVLIFGVTADGPNPVTLIGGTGVTIRASASTVAASSTLTIYLVFDNVGTGTEAVTIY